MASRSRPSADPLDQTLGAALAGIEPPAASVEVSAGFFHRTLARWLGLPEGRAGKNKAAPRWDYDFWKAELVDHGELDGRRVFLALLHRSPEEPPERYRYWLRLDDRGRIRASGWIDGAPDLLREHGDPIAFAEPPAQEPAMKRILLMNDEEPAP